MQARFQITAVSRDVAPQVIDLPQHSEPCVSSSLSITDSAAAERVCVFIDSSLTAPLSSVGEHFLPISTG